MRRIIFKNRWNIARRPYSGDWRQNPWINSTDNSSRARIEAPDYPTQERQQQAAIRTWEEEGGSIRTAGTVLQ